MDSKQSSLNDAISSSQSQRAWRRPVCCEYLRNFHHQKLYHLLQFETYRYLNSVSLILATSAADSIFETSSEKLDTVAKYSMASAYHVPGGNLN